MEAARFSGLVVPIVMAYGPPVHHLEIDHRKIVVERLFGRVDVFLREESRLAWWRTMLPYGILILLGPIDAVPALAFRPIWGKDLLAAATAAGWDPQKDRAAYESWRDRL